jgi:hypothetical protein
MGPGGELFDGHLPVQVPLHPGQHVAGRVALRARQRTLDVLRLAPVAVRRHHHPAGDVVGDLRAVLLAYDMEAGIDPGRGPGRGDHRTRVDVQHIRVDEGPRVAAASAWACRQ